LDVWLRSRGYRKGAIVVPLTLYHLGADWYATRLEVDWKPDSAEEATALFEKHGLVGEFWSLIEQRC
jgi:hypothetical protein